MVRLDDDNFYLSASNNDEERHGKYLMIHHKTVGDQSAKVSSNIVEIEW